MLKKLESRRLNMQWQRLLLLSNISATIITQQGEQQREALA